MFLYQSIPWYSIVMWFVVLGGLMALNELARLSKWTSLALFLVLPAVLTFSVWPQTAGEGSSVGTWFHWAKVYSALAGCLGFLALRHIKGWDKKRLVLFFPAFILALNIGEAVLRDFQVYFLQADGKTAVDGVMMLSGPWNLLNGIAGILNIVTISGWRGIFVGKDKKKDMLWPDQLWFWIIAYDIWNFAYVYNCVGDHSFYAGAALLVSCTIPAFFLKRGAWLQHRAQTLGFWMMFVMCFPSFVDTSMFAVKASLNPAALWTVSVLSLAVNVAVFVYHFAKAAKHRRNPVTTEVHPEVPAFQLVAAGR